MKNRKRSFVSFHYRDCDTFAAYLHEQSLEGWHFKEWRLGLVFERGEPQDIVYAVEVFPKGSEIDTKPEPDAQEYAEYCRAAGWELVDGQRRFCIFRRVKEDAVPIVEPEERYANIRRAEWREWWNIALCPLVLAVMWWWDFWFISFKAYVLNDIKMFLLAVITFEAAVVIEMAAALFLWMRRAKQRLARGESPTVCRDGTRMQIPAVRWLFVCAALVICVLFAYRSGMTQVVLPVLLVLVLLVSLVLVLAIRRPSRASYLGIQYASALGAMMILMIAVLVIIAPDAQSEPAADVQTAEFPLMPQDYDKDAGAVVYAFSDSADSMVGSMQYYSVECLPAPGEEPQSEAGTGAVLVYTVYQSRYSWVLDRLWKQEAKRFAGAEDCSADWQAKQALCQRGADESWQRLLRYEDRVILISTDGAFDDSQAAVVREKLLGL